MLAALAFPRTTLSPHVQIVESDFNANPTPEEPLAAIIPVNGTPADSMTCDHAVADPPPPFPLILTSCDSTNTRPPQVVIIILQSVTKSIFTLSGAMPVGKPSVLPLTVSLANTLVDLILVLITAPGRPPANNPVEVSTINCTAFIE